MLLRFQGDVCVIETHCNESQPAPTSCCRPVHGNLTYQVVGQHYNRHTIEALMLPTLSILRRLFSCWWRCSLGRRCGPYRFRPMMDGNQYIQSVKVDLDSQRIYSRR